MPAHAPVAQFGVHLSGFARGVDPAAEAKHIEALGFDLVAIDRDVMGGPTPGLEVWTTLTWVAARNNSVATSRAAVSMRNSLTVRSSTLTIWPGERRSGSPSGQSRR